MLKHSALFIIIILLVTMLSGCSEIPMLSGILGGTEVKQYEHDIVVIRDIKVTPTPTVRPGQIINVHVYIKDVQAVGQHKKRAKITLYDDCGIVNIQNMVGCEDGNSDGKTYCDLEMYPQSENELIWTLKAKNLEVEQSCKLGFQVEYEHITKTISSVEFASQTEIENMIQQGKGKTSTGKMTVGEGPVKLYIQVPGQPILLNRANTGSQFGNGVIEFWVENKGSGLVVDNEVKRYEIKAMKSTLANIKFKKPDGSEVGEKIIGKKGDKSGAPTKLINRKTPAMSWILEPTSTNNALDQKVSFTMQLEGEVEYLYKFTKTTPITVQPLL